MSFHDTSRTKYRNQLASIASDNKDGDYEITEVIVEEAVQVNKTRPRSRVEPSRQRHLTLLTHRSFRAEHYATLTAQTTDFRRRVTRLSRDQRWRR
jgi:hypothetical protein